MHSSGRGLAGFANFENILKVLAIEMVQTKRFTLKGRNGDF